MMKFNKEGQESFVRTFSIGIAVISMVATLALAALEAYVRWTLNKDFTFLGGSTLAALAVSSFGLLAALLFVTRK